MILRAKISRKGEDNIFRNRKVWKAISYPCVNWKFRITELVLLLASVLLNMNNVEIPACCLIK